MADLGLRHVPLLTLSGVYVDALHDGKADWRDYYRVSSELIRPERPELAPDDE